MVRHQMAFPSQWPPALSRSRILLPAQCVSPIRSVSAKRPRVLPPSVAIADSVQSRALNIRGDLPSTIPIARCTSRVCRLFDIRDTCIPYQDAWDWQHELVQELKDDPEALDALMLLEHEPVYTLGTASKLENVLFNGKELRCTDGTLKRNCRVGNEKPPALIRTERGGEVTYHGPGQLVVYPIINLKRYKLDLHWYIRSLEDVVIEMLQSHYGLSATRKNGLTGVWVGEDKICALGLKVSKWITMHGLALNVNLDLAPFRRIIPCGIDDCGVTSLAALLGAEHICMDSARDNFATSFAKVFGPLSLRVEGYSSVLKSAAN